MGSALTISMYLFVQLSIVSFIVLIYEYVYVHMQVATVVAPGGYRKSCVTGQKELQQTLHLQHTHTRQNLEGQWD